MYAQCFSLLNFRANKMKSINNTIRDKGSTALLTLFALFNNFFTVYTIGTALLCLNSSMPVYIVREG